MTKWRNPDHGEHCECGQKINPGDRVFIAADGGFVHASCMGWPNETDADGFFDLETGEPVDQIPEPFEYRP